MFNVKRNDVMKTKHVLIVFVFFFLVRIAVPCTRVVYKGPGNLVITARSMDWKDEIPVNLWIFPRDMEREGKVGSFDLPNTEA